MRSYFGISEGDAKDLIKRKMEEGVDDLDEKLRAMLPPFRELLSLIVEDENYLKLEYVFKHALIQEVVYNSLLQIRMMD